MDVSMPSRAWEHQGTRAGANDCRIAQNPAPAPARWSGEGSGQVGVLKYYKLLTPHVVFRQKTDVNESVLTIMGIILLSTMVIKHEKRPRIAGVVQISRPIHGPILLWKIISLIGV
jgi:hypothetical protein